MSQSVFGHRWYKLLVPSEDGKAHTLMDRYGTDIGGYNGRLLVCMTPQGSTATSSIPSRLFGFFTDYLEFVRYQHKYFPLEHRYFYEIIFGALPQKHYFDMEASDGTNLQETLMAVIDGVVQVYEEKKWNLSLEQDVLIYSSHNSEKQSYHLVITNHCCGDNKENMAFHNLVKSKVGPHLTKYIDSRVYSSNQQLRILGSQKVGSGRVKTFHKEFIYHGRRIVHQYLEEPESLEHEIILQLEESLISVTHNCQLLSLLVTEVPTPTYAPTEELVPDTIHQALNVVNNIETYPFRYIGTRGSFILLRRIRPSMCQLCNRIHEHENPFLTVKDGEVYLHCRRAPPGQKVHIGPIAKVVKSDVTNDSTPSQVERSTSRIDAISLMTLRVLRSNSVELLTPCWPVLFPLLLVKPWPSLSETATPCVPGVGEIVASN